MSDTKSTILQRGIELVKLAVVADEQGNYQKAYRHYKDALDYLHLALKTEARDNVKEFLQEKVNVFASRAELLREHMERHSSEQGTSESGHEDSLVGTKGVAVEGEGSTEHEP